MEQYRVAIIGGGIVGLATCLALIEAGLGDVVLIEAETDLGRHQTGHNSGVIHAGLYYRPGSLKARLCAAGRSMLYDFCRRHVIPHRRSGKLIVATGENELAPLARLEENGRANGLDGIERLDPDRMREREPDVGGIAGLWVPQTGVVDFTKVAEAMARLAGNAGASIRTGSALLGVRRDGAGLALETASGPIGCRGLINCAGLHADRVARLCGARPSVRIVPFRGSYAEVAGESAKRVRGLIYPVPDPRLPFLGVHLTRGIDDSVEAGPNALFAFTRDDLGGGIDVWELFSTLAWPGFWLLAGRRWRSGLVELRRAARRGAFAGEARRLLPSLDEADLRPGGFGLRAQAVDGLGRLVDDFHLLEDGAGMIHVLNAPSPAATASLAIGRWIALRAAASLDLPLRKAGLEDDPLDAVPADR